METGLLVILLIVLGVVLYIFRGKLGSKEYTKSNDHPNRSSDNLRRCSVCRTTLISKAEAVRTANFNDSDRTCNQCGTKLCFGCAAKEGSRRGFTNTCMCPKCGTNLNA
jgi:hypothetical protein